MTFVGIDKSHRARTLRETSLLIKTGQALAAWRRVALRRRARRRLARLREPQAVAERVPDGEHAHVLVRARLDAGVAAPRGELGVQGVEVAHRDEGGRARRRIAVMFRD